MNYHPTIDCLVEQVRGICTPLKVILFSRKSNLSEELTSFKICVVVENGEDTSKLEARLYLELTSENPFDVLVYNKDDWEGFLDDSGSFASHIAMTGTVLYEQEK